MFDGVKIKEAQFVSFYFFVITLLIFCFCQNLYSQNKEDVFFQSECFDYFEKLDASSSVEEAIVLLLDFKNELKSLGYEIPSLSEMCLFFGDELSKRNVPIDDESISAICEKIRIQEDQISIEPASFSPKFSHQNFKTLQVRNQKNKEEKKELEVSDDFAIGFIKAFGGALLCVIPHPVAWGAGVYFMTKGVDEMIDSVKNSRSQNIEERMRQLPPPPDRHKYK